jgi:NitT/TauT family transport system substrate-binding protein
VVSGELIRENPDMVEQIVSTHIKATEYNKDNIDEASEIFAAKTGWEVEKVDKSLADWDGIWISDTIRSGIHRQTTQSRRHI